MSVYSACNFKMSPVKSAVPLVPSPLLVEMNEAPPARYCSNEWLEFLDWLDSCLDGWGLDAALYARCVLSILRQPVSEFSAETVDYSDDELPASPLGAVTPGALVSSRRRDSSGYASADTSMSSLSFSSTHTSSFSGPRLPSVKEKSNASPAKIKESQKAALLECLKSVELNQKLLNSFVDEVVSRYESIKDEENLPGLVWGDYERQNDSVDSGVCPSPAEEQNYDEAFPPLSESDSTPRAVHSLDLSGIWLPPLDGEQQEQPQLQKDRGGFFLGATPALLVPSSAPVIDGETAATKAIFITTQPGHQFSPNSSDSKFLSPCSTAPFTTEWTATGASRRLRSCPDDLWRLGEMGGGGCGKVSEIGSGFAGHQPHFVMPKFSSPSHGSVKVGSCPTRLEFCYSGPPAQPDLSCWLCAQYVKNEGGKGGCTHTCANAAGQPAPTGAANAEWRWSSTSGLFDVPKYVLHIINEDEANNYHHQRDRIAGQWEYNLWGSVEGGIEKEEEAVGDFGFCVPKVLESVKSANALASLVQADSAELEAKTTTKVSISDQTHFVPIKCKSMEGAYYPRPKFDLEAAREAEEGRYATETFENEEYYVLRQPAPISKGKKKVEIPREPSEKSLRLKFKADLPEKECQTDHKEVREKRTDSIVEEWEKYRWVDTPVLSISGRESMERSSSFLAHLSRSVDTHLASFSDEIPSDLTTTQNSRNSDRIVLLASGCSVWEDQPKTAVVDWLSSDVGVEENLAPACRALSADYTEEDHDRSMDEDELLLKYVSSISLISQLNAAN